MYFGSVQMSGERVSSSHTDEFCGALEDHKIKILSLRECGISKKNFMKLMVSLGYCKSILHLNLNHCGLACKDRVDMVAATLNLNKSLNALLMHGNKFGTEGVVKIVKSLMMHPNITSLDVGDCDIGDRGLKYICELLPPSNNKPGLQELVLSGNPRVTSRAWEKFSVALSACSTLRALYIDFNDIGDIAGKMLIVSAAGHPTLSVLDMEACGISDEVARLLLHLLQRYPTALTHVLLEDNDISLDTIRAIRLALGESDSEGSESCRLSTEDSCHSEHEYEEDMDSCIRKKVPTTCDMPLTSCPCKTSQHYGEKCNCGRMNPKIQMRVKDNLKTEDGDLIHETDNMDTTYEVSIQPSPRFDFTFLNAHPRPINKHKRSDHTDDHIYCEISPASEHSEAEPPKRGNGQSDLSDWETDDGDWLIESPHLTEYQRRRQNLYSMPRRQRKLTESNQKRDSDDDYEFEAMHIFGKRNNKLTICNIGVF